jgi:hypothetical protein
MDIVTLAGQFVFYLQRKDKKKTIKTVDNVSLKTKQITVPA